MADGNYNINLDVKFAPLTKIDVTAYGAAQTPWWNQTLLNVNDCVVRLGVLDGDFHWHKHDDEDEFFYVTEGKLVIDFEGSSVELLPGQGVVVPRGVMHCPHAIGRTVVLMFEGAGVIPTGD